MTLKLFNTLTRKKAEFKPAKAGTVRWYACGITPYDYAHIGNYRTYVLQDVLRRYFGQKGWKVREVMNFTDVDDKTIDRSKKLKIALRKYTDKYIEAFFEDCRALNIEKAEVYPRATEHIGEMVALAKKLLKKGAAYRSADGSVYFDVRKFPSYGKLSHTSLEGLKEGARVSQDNYEKNEPSDFALWKAWNEADGEVFWQTELGKGRPGWHIECSAMAEKYLGSPLDLHSGGVDLVFPHHENEIAQSEGANGKKFSRFWLHCEHLLVDGRKMSKSLGNFLTLRQVLEKGHSPAALRWLLLSAHYRQQLNFTFEGLSHAEETVGKLAGFLQRLREVENSKSAGEDKEAEKLVEGAKKDFGKAMDDDLNTPMAIAAVFELVKGANKLMAENALSQKGAKEIEGAMKEFDGVLGVLEIAAKEHEVGGKSEKWVEGKIRERDEARAARDFKKSDAIRKELAQKGIVLEDTPEGTRYRRA